MIIRCFAIFLHISFSLLSLFNSFYPFLFLLKTNHEVMANVLFLNVQLINLSPIRSHRKHRYRNIYRIHLNVSWYVANERHNRCKQKNNNAFITRSVSFFPSSIIPRCWLYWIITFFDVIQACMCFFLCSHVATRILYLSEKKKKRHI